MPSNQSSDWFALLVGFRERDYHETQRQLRVEGKQLHSLLNGQSYGIGELEILSLRDLRARVRLHNREGGRPQVKIVQGDVGELHGAQEFSGALFQVASQFNLLEMIGPEVTPEDRVTRYYREPTLRATKLALPPPAALVYDNAVASAGVNVSGV